MQPTERDDIRELVIDVLDTADNLELDALRRFALALVRRRRILRGDRRRDRARRHVLLAGLRELRDAPTYTPPHLEVISGGTES